MHGKKRKHGTQFAGDTTPAPDNSRINFLEGEVAALRREIAALTQRVKLVEQERQFGYFDSREDVQIKKPGRRPKISDEDLFGNRDGLVIWLEGMWPDLARKLYAAKTAQNIVAVISEVYDNAPAGREGRTLLQRSDINLLPFQRRLLENAQSLLDFMRSKRFRRKPTRATVIAALTGSERAAARLPPRQIADALAGVPDIGWRTSLDRCSNRPNRQGVARCGYFAKMYNLTAYWIETVREGESDSPRVFGPFFNRMEANGRAKELRAEGMKARILAGKADEPPPGLAMQPRESDAKRKADDESRSPQ